MWRGASAVVVAVSFLLCGCPYSVVAEGFDRAAPLRDAAVGDVLAFDHAATDRGSTDQSTVNCDLDEDGYRGQACGGDDCDDSNRTIHPGAAELCSFVDENCDSHNNEQLDCTFVACGPDVLYRIDPFLQTVVTETDVTLPGTHGLLDIDIDTNGQLLAVTADGLYRVSSSGQMSLLANVDTPTNTNGMAIDSRGTIYITNSDAAASTAYTIDRSTGTLNVIGSLAPYVSSGDCVQTKDDSLYMTAPDPNDSTRDLLVFVDSTSAVTHSIGAIGFGKVFGLSASFGFLFGVTDQGKVLAIDRQTGQGRLLFTAANLQFWGAANGD
jgi:hypothetical protein